jgi:hypothetical protein
MIELPHSLLRQLPATRSSESLALRCDPNTIEVTPNRVHFCCRLQLNPPPATTNRSCARRCEGRSAKDSNVDEATHMTSHHRPSNSWLASPSTVAGAGAGLVSSIITCPLDVVKTRLQAQRAGRGRMDYLGVFGTYLPHNSNAKAAIC